MKKIKLKDVLKVKRGTSLSGKYYSTTGKFIRLTLGNFNYPNGGFKENTSKEDIYFIGSVRDEFILKKGDVITPLTEQVQGLLGETAFIPEDDKYIQSGDIGLIIPDQTKLDKNFAYYLISSSNIKKQLGAAAQQTKIRHTSPDKIEDCEAWIPELDIQRKVGVFFNNINKKINNNNEIIKNLEELMKTLYQRWFLEFEFPNEEGKPYKSSDGKIIWNEELKQEIPEGWNVEELKNIVKIVLGGTPDTNNSNYWGGNINWLNSGELCNNPIVDSEEKITEYGLNNSATCLMKEGTTVISITGNIRTSILAINSCANQSVVGIIENENMKSVYIYPFMTQLINHYTKTSMGNCQKHINKGIIENSKILIPDEDILNNSYDKTIPIVEEMKNIALENKKLKEIRDYLLPMLMNGQINVDDVEIWSDEF